MSLSELAPELLTQVFTSLHSITDVLNLAQTCKRLHYLLRSSQRLATLFAAAEREFGPVIDILRLVTTHRVESAWGRSATQFAAVAQNIELLKQVIGVGRVARKIEDLYPARKWGNNRYLERRSLTEEESWRLRRAVYRYWLYCETFQNRSCTRGSRCLPQIVEERNRLLRDWTSDELFEIEDIRIMLLDILSTELCPTYGAVERWFRENCDFSGARYQQQNSSCLLYQQTPPHLQNANLNWNSWPPDRYNSRAQMYFLTSSPLFHSLRDDLRAVTKSMVPVPQRRKTEMRGWGDDIEQYYVVESMLKLNPGQIMYLYENITTRDGVERYIEEEIGSEWFWDNGQTWVDSWTSVVLRRGWDPDVVVTAIEDGKVGIVGDKLGATLDLGLNGLCDDEGNGQASTVICL